MVVSGVAGFGILLGGCMMDPSPNGTTIVGNTIEVTCNRGQVRMPRALRPRYAMPGTDAARRCYQELDGFFFRTNHNATDEVPMPHAVPSANTADPVRFSVDASNDGQTWTKIGAPSFRFQVGQARYLPTRARYWPMVACYATHAWYGPMLPG
eukprot:1924959-Rhodomonas_salina.2